MLRVCFAVSARPTGSVHSATMTESAGFRRDDSGARDYSEELLSAVTSAIPVWVASVVARVAPGSPLGEAQVNDRVAAASTAMVEGTRAALQNLFSRDVEEQRTNPLQVLREQARVLTDLLTELGADPVVRDEFDRTAFPDDVFGVGPHTWRDLGDEVHEAGITWGAWKAATVISRHRSEGDRQ